VSTVADNWFSLDFSGGQIPCLMDGHSYCAYVTTPAADAPISTPRQSPGRNVLNVTIFLLVLGVSCVALGRFQPFWPVPNVVQRFQYFTAQMEKFDTIFIGSSRILNQVIPRQFDAENAARGVSTHSLSLGYSGMWPPESYYFLRQLLAQHPRHLRWVVIELMDDRFVPMERGTPTLRMVYWHDWKHTGMAIRFVMESSKPLLEKAQQLAWHTGLFLHRMANAGRGVDWWRAIFFPKKDKADKSWIETAGFYPVKVGQWGARARADFAQEILAFQQSPLQRLRPGLASAVRDLIGEVRRAGAEPVFVLPPSVRPEEKLGEGWPPGTVVWAFNDPAEYPRLFLPELRHDLTHLDEDGAREFTSLLAQRFSDLARQR